MFENAREVLTGREAGFGCHRVDRQLRIEQQRLRMANSHLVEEFMDQPLFLQSERVIGPALARPLEKKSQTQMINTEFAMGFRRDPVDVVKT